MSSPELNSFWKLPRRLWLRAAGYAAVCLLLAEAATFIAEHWIHGVSLFGELPPDAQASIRAESAVNLLLSLTVFGSLVLMARKQEDAHAEQARAEARFRHLIEATSDTILVLDAAGVVQYASASGTELLGVPAGELPGRRLETLLQAGSATQAEQLLNSLLNASGSLQRGMLLVATRTGESRTVDVVAKNLLADESIRGLVLHCRDITLQQRSAQQRAEAEERLTMALEAGRMGVFEWNLRTGQVQGNDTLRALMGISLPGPCRGEDFLLNVAGPDREALAAELATARARWSRSSPWAGLTAADGRFRCTRSSARTHARRR